jgi:hypothetical protein
MPSFVAAYWGPQQAVTIHAAGCAHARWSTQLVPIDAADAAEAIDIAADYCMSFLGRRPEGCSCLAEMKQAS